MLVLGYQCEVSLVVVGKLHSQFTLQRRVLPPHHRQLPLPLSQRRLQLPSTRANTSAVPACDRERGGEGERERNTATHIPDTAHNTQRRMQTLQEGDEHLNADELRMR